MSIEQIVAAIGGGLGAFALAIQSFRTGVSRSQRELADGLREQILQQKEARDIEHSEFVAYRERTHLAANESNATILTLTDQISDLRAKSDLTPMYLFNEQHSLAMKAIMDTLRTQGEAIQTIMRRLDHHDTQP